MGVGNCESGLTIGETIRMITKSALNEVDQDINFSPVVWNNDEGVKVGWNGLVWRVGFENVIGVGD